MTSHSGKRAVPWLLVCGMTNFGPRRKGGQRGDGKFIVLVEFKCDQCFGFQGRAQETKNN